MKHLKDYFDNFELCKLKSLFDDLYQDDWIVSKENLVDAFGTEWNYADINCFVSISRPTFNIIVEGYRIFLELLEDSNTSSEKSSIKEIQEKLESANSKIRLLEEQNNALKKELDLREKQLFYLGNFVESQKVSKTEIPVGSPKPKVSTKEYIALKRRNYVKIE